MTPCYVFAILPVWTAMHTIMQFGEYSGLTINWSKSAFMLLDGGISQSITPKYPEMFNTLQLSTNAREAVAWALCHAHRTLLRHWKSLDPPHTQKEWLQCMGDTLKMEKYVYEHRGCPHKFENPRVTMDGYPDYKFTWSGNGLTSHGIMYTSGTHTVYVYICVPAAWTFYFWQFNALLVLNALADS